MPKKRAPTENPASVLPDPKRRREELVAAENSLRTAQSNLLNARLEETESNKERYATKLESCANKFAQAIEAYARNHVTQHMLHIFDLLDKAKLRENINDMPPKTKDNMLLVGPLLEAGGFSSGLFHRIHYGSWSNDAFSPEQVQAVDELYKFLDTIGEFLPT